MFENRTRRGIALGALAGLAFGSIAPTAAQQDTIRFGTALSLTGHLATEGKQVRGGHDFFAGTVNGRGGIDAAGKKYKVAIVYDDDDI